MNADRADSPAATDEPTPSDVPRVRRRELVPALGLVLFLFILFGLGDRLLHAGLPNDRLDTAHKALGILASLSLAGLVGWLILRSSPPLFLGRAAEHDATAVPVPTKEEREARYAEWFILMRWIAVVSAAALVFISVRVVHYLPQAVLAPLTITVGSLALLNLVYLLILRRGASHRASLIAQAYCDLAILTVLIHFSGGVENPLGTLMLFHVIIAGVVLSRRQCYLVAAVAAGLFASLALAEWSGLLQHFTLSIFPHSEDLRHAAHDNLFVASRVALQAGLLFLTAYFATTITTQLHRGERQLERYAGELLAQRQLLERSLTSTGTALCVCDGGLDPIWSNDRWRDLFGPGVSSDPLGQRGRLQSARETLADGSIRVMEVVLPIARSPDADDSEVGERTFLLTTAPLTDKDGTFTHVVEVAREVTELKRIRERIARAEQLAAVGELAGKIAHEVNNPIAVISAKARLLLADADGELPARAAEELTKITDLTDRVARIAQGLLSYCRPSPEIPRSVQLPDIARRAVAFIESKAAAAGVAIDVDVAENIPPVRAAAGELEQVFMNLLMNALDAMPAGGRLRISISADRRSPGGEAHHVRATVSDTGIGIPPEIQRRIFEPFFSTKRPGQGTGLGLSICLGLIRSNRGSIEVESREGEGTQVTVRLPLDADDPEATYA